MLFFLCVIVICPQRCLVFVLCVIVWYLSSVLFVICPLCYLLFVLCIVCYLSCVLLFVICPLCCLLFVLFSVWFDICPLCYLLFIFCVIGGAGAQWLERRTRDWKVAGSNPCRSDGRIFFSSVNFLCWLLFRYPFYPRVTTVASKRSRSFCQKCRLQVTAKHACTLRMWLCLKWHGAWLYGVHRTCAETAAVSCGTSHASAVSRLHHFGGYSKTRL